MITHDPPPYRLANSRSPSVTTRPTMIIDDDWWTTEDVARHLGVATSTVRAYVARGQFPQAERRFGKTPVWRPATVINHKSLRDQRRQGGSD